MLCGNCCRDRPGRERRIFLTEADLGQIQKSGVKTKFYRKSERATGPYEYEMVKKDGGCIFLSGNRCTIYWNRPLICRFYPFTMFEADGYVFDVDRDCGGLGLGEVVNKRCYSELIREAKKTIRRVTWG